METEKRRALSDAEKLRVVQRQLGLCNCGCREKLAAGQIHYDHIVPLWCGGSNMLSNFQALITKHHAPKTAKEAAARAKADRIANRDGMKTKRLSKRDKEMQKWLGRA